MRPWEERERRIEDANRLVHLFDMQSTHLAWCGRFVQVCDDPQAHAIPEPQLRKMRWKLHSYVISLL